MVPWESDHPENTSAFWLVRPFLTAPWGGGRTLYEAEAHRYSGLSGFRREARLEQPLGGRCGRSCGRQRGGRTRLGVVIPRRGFSLHWGPLRSVGTPGRD